MLASQSAFDAAATQTDREHEARVRAATIVAEFRKARAAINEAEQVFVSAGIESADGHLAAAERAIAALRGRPRVNAMDALKPITAQVRPLDMAAWK